MAANRAKFRGLTVLALWFSGNANWLPRRPMPFPYRFFGDFRNSGIPPNFQDFATSELAPENGSLAWGFRAPGGRIWGVAIGSWPGPISASNIFGVLVLRGREPASRVTYSPPNDFSRISGIPGIPEFPDFLRLSNVEFRQVSRIFATSDLAPRKGSLLSGFRALRGRIFCVAIGS